MTRRLMSLLALLIAGSALAAEAPMRRIHLLDGTTAATRIHFSGDGTIKDAWGLAIEAEPDPVAAAERIATEEASLLFGDGGRPELRVLDIRASLVGAHVRFRQTIDGIPVIGATFSVDLDTAQQVHAIHNHVARRVARTNPESFSSDFFTAGTGSDGLPVLEDEIVYLNIDDTARLVRRVVVAVDVYRSEARYLDVDGRVIMIEPLWLAASTRVFDPNPVTRTGDTGLHDQNDAAEAVPEESYSIVNLLDVSATGRLRGPNVTIIDTESPTTVPTDMAKSLVFDRADDRFEEVMAYYHLDRSQRYIQSLGFTGTRHVVGRSLRVDAHGASGADNSYYSIQAGEGSLFFGDGGVDDAEDPDILLHEYGHAIHESIAPGAFTGQTASQGRALGEAFGDYWAFSDGYPASLELGRDPYCIGEWDARCADDSGNRCSYPRGATCLRRVDGTKTMADFLPNSQSGTEHKNGEIFSSALREIFEAIVARNGRYDGRRIADTLVLESIFGLPVFTSYETAAMSLIEADRLLDDSAYHEVVCAAMVRRSILPSGACAAGPRGEFVEFPATGRDIPLPTKGMPTLATREIEADGIVKRVRVGVAIAHPRRGDLRVTLIAPRGERVVLASESSDARADLNATFGFDTPSDDSLDSLRGLGSRGTWSLEVVDTGSIGGGTLRFWDLELELEGTTAIDARPAASSESRHVIVVANVAGAAGTRFVTDLSIRNANSESRMLTLFFTPSGADGRISFRAVRLSIAPRQTFTLRDLVVTEFDTVGVGNIEIQGDLEGIQITSRTYNNASTGTYGQFVPSVSSDAGTGANDAPLEIAQLEVDAGFRSNLGVTELAGADGSIEVVIRDETGDEIERVQFGLPAWSHLQIPVLAGRTASRARAEVRVLAGNARIAAYGSVIDNRSGDPIYIPARLSDSTPRSRRVPAAANVPGALSTRWRTDLWLTNSSVSDEIVTLSFHPAGGGDAIEDDVLVPAGGIVSIPDVVGARFGLDHATGQIAVSSSSIIVTSRTWNENQQGTFGQFVEGVDDSAAIGIGEGALMAIGLDLSDDFRTNVGFAEVSGHGATVLLTILDDAGNAIRDVSVYVAANGQVQFGIGQIGLSELRDGAARFEVLGGAGRIIAYAATIDNRSSDPTFVPASRTP